MFKVQFRPKDGDPVVMTVSVHAVSWTDAVKRALHYLSMELVPEDRESVGRSEFRVIDPLSGHHYVVRSLADLQAQTRRENLSRERPGSDAGLDKRTIAQSPRPAKDVVKTVNNPRGWRPQRQEPASTKPPQIRSDRLKPGGELSSPMGSNKPTRKQFARVMGWTNPSAEVSDIVAKAVDMTWQHIPCAAVQCFVPIEGSECFSVAAAKGEPGFVIMGSRIQFPEDLHDLATSEIEPVAFQADGLRLLYETLSGNIVSQHADAVLWVPVVVSDELRAILVAMDPKEGNEFTDGVLNGAVYLAETLARRLGSESLEW